MSEEEPVKKSATTAGVTKFRYVGDHAQDLGSGAMLGPGDFVDLDSAQMADETNKRLIDEGKLIPA